MAYFDNAATSYPKPDEVYAFMDSFYRNHGGSAGRGDYEKALSVSRLADDTRHRVQKLLNCPAKQVIFTPTATIALNIIIQGLLQGKRKTVYTTPFEHNAVMRMLYHYEKMQETKICQLKVDNSLCYDINEIKKQFEDCCPDVLVINHVSNVCGLISPVEELSVLAKQYGAIVIVDMAQSAGLVNCNIGLETIDFAVFAGHKTLYGPTGLSGFVMKPTIEMQPILFGGTGYDSANHNMPSTLPERFEMGTLNSLGIAGLNAALVWIEQTGIDTIWKKEQDNRRRLINLLSQYSFIRFVGLTPDNDYAGIVSVLVDDISSDSCGSVFNRLGIAVRAGLQCAPLAHQFLGTFPSGTVRFSVGFFTSDNDFIELQNALTYIKDNL